MATVIFFWLLVSAAVAILASRYNRSGFGWLVLALLLSPLLAGIFLLAAGPRGVEHEAKGRRPCPYCKELIVPGALKCRFCGSDIPPQQQTQALALNLADKDDRAPIIFIACALLVLIIIGIGSFM